jgi:hypothetical protein
MSYNIVSYFVEICGFLLIMIAQFHHDRTEILFKVEFNDHTPIKVATTYKYQNDGANVVITSSYVQLISSQ